MKFFGAIVLFFFFIPLFASAQVFPSPLVPECSGSNLGTGFFEGACTLCDLAKLFNNVVAFAVALSVIAATLMLVYAGVLYFSAAGGGQEQIKKAHKIFTNVVIGLVFVLAAWLIVDLLVKTLTDGAIGPWNEVECGEYPAIVIPDTPVLPSGGVGFGGTESDGVFDYDPGILAQAGDASGSLNTFLTCMRNNLPGDVGRVSSISDCQIQGNCVNPPLPQRTWEECRSGHCQHEANSCHYGGDCTAGSYAVDFGDAGNRVDLFEVGGACSELIYADVTAVYIDDEGDHIHMSIGARHGCGCN